MGNKYLMMSMAILGACAFPVYAENEEFLSQGVSNCPVSVFNLNFNRQGNSIVARSGKEYLVRSIFFVMTYLLTMSPYIRLL